MDVEPLGDDEIHSVHRLPVHLKRSSSSDREPHSARCNEQWIWWQVSAKKAAGKQTHLGSLLSAHLLMYRISAAAAENLNGPMSRIQPIVRTT